jgi:hypothetical protein
MLHVSLKQVAPKENHFLHKKSGITLGLATSKARKETKTLSKAKTCRHYPGKNHLLRV